MKSLGLVIGGERAIVESMLDALGPNGTMMMPAFSGDNSDPREWQHPPVPPACIADVKEATPSYHPDLTSTRGVGRVAEYFRKYPGALRSGHPQSSFAAVGKCAEYLTTIRTLDDRFGVASPLSNLANVNGKVLLLGAPRDTASLFHLTQHYLSSKRIIKREAKMGGAWVPYWDVEYPCDWFDIGMGALIRSGIASVDSIGNAPTVLFPAREAVDFLVAWRKAPMSLDTLYDLEMAGADLGLAFA